MLAADVFVDDRFPDTPQWLHDLAVKAHDMAHDVMAFSGVSVTCHLWIGGAEDRRLPMPLRFAAPHPCSPAAILGVLTSLTERPIIGKESNDEVQALRAVHQ